MKQKEVAKGWLNLLLISPQSAGKRLVWASWCLSRTQGQGKGGGKTTEVKVNRTRGGRERVAKAGLHSAYE